MKTTTGYYSLIQFCPDPSRLEAANVGVLLFAPACDFLKAVTVHDNRRIRQFFGREGFDWERINSFKKGIEERVQSEQTNIRKLDDLKEFIARRANRFVLTEPRSMRVTDPDKDLEQLFHDLVGGELRTKKSQSLISFLGQRIVEAGLEQKVRKDIRIKVPAFDREVEIPYGYQNGRFNLVKSARFRSADENHVITTACRHAIEGRSLYDHDDREFGKVKLVVVGDFASNDTIGRATAKRILEENSVDLYVSTNLERLIADIRDNAKPFSEAK
jgi:hypothetical protein